MKKLLSLVLVFALLLSCVVLCAQAEAADAVVRVGTLKVGKTNKLTGFDPSKTSSRNEDGYVYYLLFETLITYDENGNLAPGLATDWSYSEDGLSMTLTLRQGVTFHDGTPFNAEAVKANMDYNTNPDTGHVYLTSELGNIVSTEVIDEYTVKINLSTVDAALPSVFTNICGLMLAPSTLGAEDMAIHPVGTGAFKLEEYVEGDHIFLTAYENYWDKGADGQALPYLDRVEIYIMGDDSVRTINLQTGDIDMVDYVIRLLEKDEMLRAPDFVRNLSLVTVVICAAFSTLLSWILCDSMTRNIQRLNQGMDKVGEGDFSIRVQVNGKDEVSQLTRKFNLFVEHLGNTTQQMVRQATAKKQMELETMDLRYRSLQT